MILVGQYDSPFVRRVAVSLRVLGFKYEHDKRSVFGDFDSIRKTNPLGRIPSLILDSGETLIDSAAILDWLDQKVGPERALLPPSGAARVAALQTIALATGAIDKAGAANYERLIRPAQHRWPQWIDRLVTQANGALTALDARPWPSDALGQAEITTMCAIDYIRITDPPMFPKGRYKSLDALAGRLEVRPEFRATSFSDYAVPRG